MSRVKTYIAQTLKNSKISIFEVDEHINEFSDELKEKLVPDFAEYGIALERFFVTRFVKPEGDTQYEKFKEYLVDGAGVRIVAISDKETPFPTIKVPSAGDFNPYVFLCAGWNLLVEIGIETGMDLDHPNRARKVGNEFIPA